MSVTDNKELLKKDEYLFLSKSDVPDEKGLKEKLKQLKKTKKDIVPISIADDKSLAEVKKILNKIAGEKKAKTPVDSGEVPS